MAHTEMDFQALFEQSPDILLVLLPDAPRFTMVGATRSRLEITHTTLEQTVGVGLFEAFPDNPDDAGASGATNLRASLERVLATRAPDTMAVQKYDIRGPDGNFQVRYWSPRNLPVISDRGEVIYILHRVEDVTDLVRAGEEGAEQRGRAQQMEREVLARSRELDAANRQLRDANARLNQLDAAKTAFFSNVSHEFRTPLTLMLGPLADALADTTRALQGAQRERVQLANDNALRLLKLVNALLDFSRLEAGRLRASFAPLDLAIFTHELVMMFQSAIEGAGLKLEVECPPLSEPIWMDATMWEKIVPNLVSNAFKFTMRGSIRVQLRETATHAVLEVADSGVGIPAAELPRIFERFHRVAGVSGRTHEGTGIGLALVRELVTQLGGTITVRSEPGVGTAFRVEIPKGRAHLPVDAHINETPVTHAVGRDAHAHVAEAARWSGAVPPEPARAEASSVPGGRVLVVDDNADLRTYIHGLLAPHYEVMLAVDGRAALQVAREQHPDLILSDVMMPQMTGIELISALRALPETASIPAILLSARAGEEATIEGLSAGCDDYLTKPFTAQELLARVRTHLQLARTRKMLIAELQQTNRELDAFSYSVAHDLRAPLRAISGFSEMLVEEHSAQLDAEGRRLLDVVRDSTYRMSQLIDDLLHLARVTRAELRRVPMDLSALVRDVAQKLQQAEPQHRVELQIADGLQVNADPQLLRVAIENLLGNAWKFTGRQSQPRIEFGMDATQPQPTYYIRDNGAGFDMAYAHKLFGVFQRLHSEREFHGTGIGLATVARIIQRHGGEIRGEGAVGRGAVFHFTLDNKLGTP